jgi:hypothetical protein
MLLAAIYYWAPLAAKWFTGPAGKPAVPAVMAAPGASASTPAVAPAAVSTTTGWRQLARWITQDPAKRPGALPDGARDPFVWMKPKPEETPTPEDEDEEPVEPPAATSTPSPTRSRNLDVDDLKLRLGGTVVGPRGRWATINGRAYREGQRIEVRPEVKESGDGNPVPAQQPSELLLTLKHIRPQDVILERNGSEYRLLLARAQLSGDDAIRRREPPAADDESRPGNEAAAAGFLQQLIRWVKSQP